MDNIAEFILQTAEEAKRRGLEICIASVRLAKPVVMEYKSVPGPVRTQEVSKPTVEKAETEKISWIGVPEAARMLRISNDCLYRRIRRGELQCKTDEHGNKLVATSILQDFVRKRQPAFRAPLRCVQTGVVYRTLTEAANAIHVCKSTLSAAVRDNRPIKNLTFEKV